MLIIYEDHFNFQAKKKKKVFLHIYTSWLNIYILDYL